MQRIRKSFLLFFILFFFGLTYAEEPIKEVKLIRFSDADSMWILVDGRRLKLIVAGIDAPEEFRSRKLRMDSKRCHISQKHIRRLGRRATSYARSILSEGKTIKVRLYRQEDTKVYGSIYLTDGSLYSEKLVKEGYACVSPGDINEKILNRLRSLLSEAKKKKKGLWKDFYKIMDCLCR
jgi:micrococcal nuclease